MDLRVGDYVYASRKAKDNSTLSSAIHPAKVLAISRSPERRGEKKMITVEYEEKKGKKYLQVDIFKFVPEGQKDPPTIIMRSVPDSQEAAASSSVSSSSSQEAVASPSPESTVSPSRKSSTSAQSRTPDRVDVDAQQVVNTPSPTSSSSIPSPESSPVTSLRNVDKIPMDFLHAKATSILQCPAHIRARWIQIDKSLEVKKLFGTNARANRALKDFVITSLVAPTGQSEYCKVPVKTGKTNEGEMGLIELFAKLGISGRTMRAKTKGLMFFFLVCSQPDNVVFPPFKPQEAGCKKRKRSPPFSLAEKGRLTAIIKDPTNADTVSMLMKKWSRSDLDAKAGRKGVSHYWDIISKLFEDPRYVPPVNNEFADYVRTIQDEDCTTVYSTSLIPMHRSGDVLKSQWKDLRKAYAVFHSKYEQSGNNQPDPTGYTKDLPVLLMFYTFYETPLDAWAAKTIDEGAVDDAGEGKSHSTMTVNKRSRNKDKSNMERADFLMAGAALYETVHKVDVSDFGDNENGERALHEKRVRRAGLIFDKCLRALELEF